MLRLCATSTKMVYGLNQHKTHTFMIDSTDKIGYSHISIPNSHRDSVIADLDLGQLYVGGLAIFLCFMG